MKTLPLALLALATVAACGDQHNATAPAVGAASRSTTNCNSRPDVTVVDEASLSAAITSAYSGEVIGIAGYFAVTGDIHVAKAGVTLTCATNGAGLIASDAVTDLISVEAPDVAVDHLVLDARLAMGQPWIAQYDGAALLAQRPRFTNNKVWCGVVENSCAVVVGGDGAVITDNLFQGDNEFDGIHVQPNGDNDQFTANDARIERNTILALTPSVGWRQGAIRTYHTDRMVIANNNISGPWANGISPAQLRNSVVTANEIHGALTYGIALSWAAGTAGLPGDFNNTFRQNSIEGAGVAGIWAFLGCYNQFIANELHGNGGNVGIVFPDSSGGNTVTGGANARIVDKGAYDCNGDGRIDQNVVRGRATGTSVASSTAPAISFRASSDLGASAIAERRVAHGIVLH